MRFYLKSTFFVLIALVSTPGTIIKELIDTKNIHTFENKKESTHFEKRYISNYKFEKGYEEAIEFIKKHEGFAGGKAYYDAAGIKTIGYGHVIKPGEVFPERITKKQAEDILKKDFDKAIKAAERQTNVKGYKKIVVAHFIYAKGIGNFMKSTFRKKVLNNEPVDEELKRWCYYRNTKGIPVRSEYLYKIRLWEIEMYNREV